MFQSFVIGPVGVGRFGLIDRCVECRVRPDVGGTDCSGFDSGCLIGRPREREEVSEGVPCTPRWSLDARLPARRD
ncbi:MAG: hypothetical protein ACXWAC_13580 [Usitatibacter sp.]